MVDRLLFHFISKSKGFTLGDVAKALGISQVQLSRRLSGKIPFKDTEILAWCNLVGCNDPVPVFFPSLCRAPIPEAPINEA